MLTAYRKTEAGLAPLPEGTPPAEALWIDMMQPDAAETAKVEALGLDVPSLQEMEEIEISNRLYREEGADYMTVVLPGLSETATPIIGPVTFILAAERLVTVRHHAPRSFETFPGRAGKSSAGCGSPDRVFIGLVEEIISRLADLLEASGRTLDKVSGEVFGEDALQEPDLLQAALQTTGRQGDMLGRFRTSLLTIERALSFFLQARGKQAGKGTMGALVDGQLRDLQALEVHADSLTQRVGLIVDATLGMINLAQNVTVRIVSVVAALFLPPTLIASLYGMNFTDMPELHWAYGYPYALCLMVGSAVFTYFFFKWKKWL